MPTFEERMALHNLRATLRREEIEREANERKARTEDRRKRVEESRVRTSALIDSLDARFKVMDQFITRMVTEYKASLVKYVERAQQYIDDSHPDVREAANSYWHCELVEATRQLTLSDAELLPLITPREPYGLADKAEDALLKRIGPPPLPDRLTNP